jgi:hypothetical protein
MRGGTRRVVPYLDRGGARALSRRNPAWFVPAGHRRDACEAVVTTVSIDIQPVDAD